MLAETSCTLGDMPNMASWCATQASAQSKCHHLMESWFHPENAPQNQFFGRDYQTPPAPATILFAWRQGGFVLRSVRARHLKALKRMSLMCNLLSRFIKNDEGAALIEYGMLVGLIAVVCVVAVGTLGQTIVGYFNSINATLSTPAA